MSEPIIINESSELPCNDWDNLDVECPLKSKSYRGEWVHCPECGILIEDERENI